MQAILFFRGKSMSSNKKITLIIFSMIMILTVIIVFLVAIGSRQTGYEGVKKKAYLTADIVKKSLTSHMVNGNMDQRDIFLNSISQLDNVKDLWVIRAKSVSEQFGKSNLSNENPRDEIDIEVLKTGKEKTIISESFFNANIRVTIPYTVSIGYSFYPNDADQIYKCIKYADISLYEAKATGRNKVIRFTKDILKNGDKLDY